MIHTTQTYQIGDNVELMRKMPAESIDTIVTSPPYWGLRDYGVDGQIGLEPTMEKYHARMLDVTAECMRVLKPTGIMFWNHGDSYGGSGGSGGDYSEGGIREGQPKVGKSIGTTPKCLTMQNERLIIKMVDGQGWILRNRIIWNKPNGMPSSVADRFSNKYEPVYMLTKNKSYWFDLDAARVPHSRDWSKEGHAQHVNRPDLKENTMMYRHGGKKTLAETYNPFGKNPGDVWTIPTQPYKESHFATFPTALIEPMIKAACPAEICPTCGIAKERIVDKEIISPRTINGVPNSTSRYSDGEPETGTRFGDVQRYTTGWTSCECDDGWIAGTVLDPFCGSGTVLEVCRLQNRNAIGLELNPEYEALIKERSMSHTPPLTAY